MATTRATRPARPTVAAANTGDKPAAKATADDATELTPGERADASDQLPDTPPTAGYVWVQRKKKSVTLGTINYRPTEPCLVDAKSVPELALVGYEIVDAPKQHDA